MIGNCNPIQNNQIAQLLLVNLFYFELFPIPPSVISVALQTGNTHTKSATGIHICYKPQKLIN